MGALDNDTMAMSNQAFGEAVGAGIAAKTEASPFLAGLLDAFNDGCVLDLRLKEKRNER